MTKSSYFQTRHFGDSIFDFVFDFAVFDDYFDLCYYLGELRSNSDSDAAELDHVVKMVERKYPYNCSS